MWCQSKMENEGEHLKSKHLIGHVNHFILETSNFLIHLLVNCEDRLETLNRQLHQLESRMTLLETNIGKLSISLT